MKTAIVLENGSSPVLQIIPRSYEHLSELRFFIQNLEIENPALTFAKEYRKLEHNEPSAFDTLSEGQLEQIASLVNSLADFWRTEQDKTGEPRLNIVKLLEILLNFVASNIIS